jgi:hypothetical protein
MILNQLTDARAAVDVRDYFEQVVWVRERRFDLRQVELTVLVAHRAGRYPKRPAVKGADERVGFGSQRRLSELFWEGNVTMECTVGISRISNLAPVLGLVRSLSKAAGGPQA